MTFPIPQRQPGPPAAAPNPAAGPRPMPPSAPSAPGGGAPGAGGDLAHLPPDVARQIDPNNPVQRELIQRANALTPPDIQALAGGIDPAAVAVLKKLLPEVGFLLDLVGKGGDAGPPADAPAQQPGTPQPMPAPGGAGAFPQPSSRLATVR